MNVSDCRIFIEESWVGTKTYYRLIKSGHLLQEMKGFRFNGTCSLLALFLLFPVKSLDTELTMIRK